MSFTKGILRKKSDSKGQIFVLTALFFPVFLMGIALVGTVGMYYSVSSNLQKAADSAALAAAQSAAEEKLPLEVAENYLAASLKANHTQEITVEPAGDALIIYAAQAREIRAAREKLEAERNEGIAQKPAESVQAKIIEEEEVLEEGSEAYERALEDLRALQELLAERKRSRAAENPVEGEVQEVTSTLSTQDLPRATKVKVHLEQEVPIILGGVLFPPGELPAMKAVAHAEALAAPQLMKGEPEMETNSVAGEIPPLAPFALLLSGEEELLLDDMGKSAEVALPFAPVALPTMQLVPVAYDAQQLAEFEQEDTTSAVSFQLAQYVDPAHFMLSGTIAKTKNPLSEGNGKEIEGAKLSFIEKAQTPEALPEELAGSVVEKKADDWLGRMLYLLDAKIEADGMNFFSALALAEGKKKEFDALENTMPAVTETDENAEKTTPLAPNALASKSTKVFNALSPRVILMPVLRIPMKERAGLLRGEPLFHLENALQYTEDGTPIVTYAAFWMEGISEWKEAEGEVLPYMPEMEGTPAEKMGDKLQKVQRGFFLHGYFLRTAVPFGTGLRYGASMAHPAPLPMKYEDAPIPGSEFKFEMSTRLVK